MNQINLFNKTLEYFESCLDSEIDKNKVFHISGYSYELFSRMFSIISGIKLSDYLRFRKLTKAAIEIVNTDKKIIDIAIQYGYESSNSFSLAFKNFHGVSPREVRNGKMYKIFSPIHFSLSIKGGSLMDIKIERKDKFTLAGLSIKTNKTSDFGELWDNMIDEYGFKFLKSLGSGQYYGVCYEVKNEEEFSYMAAFDSKNINLAREKGLEILEIAEAEYAIIPLKGKVPDCIHRGWEYVMGTFLPENGLKHSGSPDFEVYSEGNPESEDYTMELWVPVEKI